MLIRDVSRAWLRTSIMLVCAFQGEITGNKNRAEEVEISPTLFPSVKSLGAETGEMNHAEGLLALDSALSPAGFITG